MIRPSTAFDMAANIAMNELQMVDHFPLYDFFEEFLISQAVPLTMILCDSGTDPEVRVAAMRFLCKYPDFADCKSLIQRLVRV